MRVSRIAVALVMLLVPTAALAQDSHWGVIGSVTPQWKVPKQLEQLFDGTVDIKGTDVSIGIARGRELGGDWGVSFIHKQFKDGSRVESVETQCGQFSNGCFQDGESITTQGVALNGLEVHKFVSFGTIRQRVQIGMNFAGGFSKITGSLVKHAFRAEFVSFDPRTNLAVGRQTETTTTEPASELIPIEIMPLVKVQAAVAVIVAPAFKIRIQGGLDLPGYEFVQAVGVVLFGGR
jgi:hypothetical protein